MLLLVALCIVCMLPNGFRCFIYFRLLPCLNLCRDLLCVVVLILSLFCVVAFCLVFSDLTLAAFGF